MSNQGSTTTTAMVPTSAPANVSLARQAPQRYSLSPSAAMIILGLTGGTDDEWLRLQRNWRLIWLCIQLVVEATRMVLPLVLRGLLRRWAMDMLAADRLPRG
jgi:hypothetical protein